MQLLVCVTESAGFERGDIVSVVTDSHRWGRREFVGEWETEGRDPDEFTSASTIIRCLDLPANLQLAEPERDETGIVGVKINKRVWRFDLTKAGDPSPGHITDIEWSTLVAAVARKRDGASIPLTPSGDGDSKVRVG